MKDYYGVLGVLPTAKSEDITAAYRRIAMRTHPDRNPDDPKAAERFRDATEAYEVLSDKDKRIAYDQAQLNRLTEDPLASAREAWNRFIDQTLQQGR